MQKQSKRIFMMGLAVLGALAGFFLRRWQLADAFDETGLMLPGRASSVALCVICAVLVAVLAALCARLSKKSGYEETFSSTAPNLIVSAAGALLVLAACAMQILARPAGISLVLGALGVLAALCILATAAGRLRGSVPSCALHFVPCIYLVVKLIVDFKHWSTDPVVLEYCFRLFAAISAMCATYHLGGFCFHKGGRRMSAFWCLTGTVMTGVCLADGGLASMLLLGGFGLWMASNAWQLLEN